LVSRPLTPAPGRPRSAPWPDRFQADAIRASGVHLPLLQLQVLTMVKIRMDCGSFPQGISPSFHRALLLGPTLNPRPTFKPFSTTLPVNIVKPFPP
jgi:hypothetical protein